MCCWPAASSRKPSTQTYSSGLSMLRENSKNSLPSSERTCSAYHVASLSHSSALSGRIGILITIRIMLRAYPFASLSGREWVLLKYNPLTDGGDWQRDRFLADALDVATGRARAPRA